MAVLRCLLQPHWTEEGVHWALMFYLQRLRQILEERPERVPEPLVTPLPRPRSSSMVAATPSLVNTHKTQVIATRRQWRDCVEMPALRRHLRYLLSSAVFAGYESEMQRGGEVSEHRDVCEGFSDQPASTGGAGPRLRPRDEHLQEGQRTIIQITPSFH